MADVRYDCIVIGAGHNGLVCATLLARGGRSVLVLEAGEQVGGAAVTCEFSAGFRVSAAAHLLHQWPDELARELALETHGLTLAARQMSTTAIAPGTAPITLGTDGSAQDQAAFAPFEARMQRFGAALAPAFAQLPPRLGTEEWADRIAMLRLGWRLRRLGRKDMREFLRIVGMNVHDLLEEQFESDLLKGALALDAVLGANFGPRSPGTVLTYLYRWAAQSQTSHGLAQPTGGMGAVAQALQKSAQAAGVTIRLKARVARIVVENDRAAGVELGSGERLAARSVVSNADPKTTFLKLLGTRHLDTGFVRRVQHLRARGLAAKVHLALSDLPKFMNVTRAQLAGRLMLAPSLEYVEHAYNPTKYGEFARAPALEITLPTLNDSSLAPAGKHVLSAVVQYAPYELRAGWQGGRQEFLECIMATLEGVAPGIRALTIGAELLTPADLETQFNLHGGHWHHADLAFDQFLMVRPVPGASQYRTPLDGLYLCGAGCHPGGGVMGVAGRNAARQVLDTEAA